MAISSISGPLRRESIEYSAQLNVKSILGQGCRCESPDSHALVRARTRADSGSPSSRIVAAKTHPSSEFRVQGTPSAGPDRHVPDQTACMGQTGMCAGPDRQVPEPGAACGGWPPSPARGAKESNRGA